MALPAKRLRSDEGDGSGAPKVFIQLGGGAGSGKGRLRKYMETVFMSQGIRTVDPDDIKKGLPEYGQPGKDEEVHKQSKALAVKQLENLLAEEHRVILVDGTAAVARPINEIFKKFKAKGYYTCFFALSCDPKIAWEQNSTRGRKVAVEPFVFLHRNFHQQVDLLDRSVIDEILILARGNEDQPILNKNDGGLEEVYIVHQHSDHWQKLKALRLEQIAAFEDAVLRKEQK